ncbi:MAG: carboxynorspermidine decarboxylase [Oscillospiraceae bacterium]|jgi:carboxynorspermidine decarboxylase|nr:carboxynorspermidine decarboxylase [Oscillospiraceae bacterium]
MFDRLKNTEAGFPLKTPCYVIDEAVLIKNLEILRALEKRTGCKVLLAQKAFSMFALYPLIGQYISGTTASGLYEARLGYEEMRDREVHVFSPAYTDEDFAELVKICDCIVFNSCGQWEKFKTQIPKNISAGLRVNPEISTQNHAIYDPCAPFSRLGATLESIQEKDLTGIEGLHFHTLCEQDSDALEVTLDEFERKFSYLFSQLKWVNLGGGHHITRAGYDIERLVKCIERMKAYGLEVYIEPGEAVALNAGWLAASVLDVVHNGMALAILDVSAACHMPDVLEMPYRPQIVGAGEAGEKKHIYRLAGNTCLAGDVIGDYSFDYELKTGDKLLFCDMAIYSMVKNNTFNGMPLPSIAVLRKNGELEIIREFGYGDFKGRLS